MQEQILKYFWVVTVVFLAAVALLSAKLTGNFIARTLWVAEVGHAPSEALSAAPVTRERFSAYRVIEERNLFNAHPKPATPTPPPGSVPSPAAQPEPALAAQPLAPLKLTLIGTAVIEGGQSFAVVESDAGVKVVREGGEVAPEAVLTQVLHDRIRVDRGGAVEEFLLYPPEGQKAPARGRARTAPRESRPEPEEPASDTIRQVEDDKWLIDNREVEEATANMSRLMTQVRVVPNFTDGQADGFKVFAIRPGSLFAKIGLRNGDVIKRINGLELEGPEQAFEAYQRLKDETSIQIDLSRANENRTFSYEIR